MAPQLPVVSVVVRGDEFRLRDLANASVDGVAQMVPAASRIETLVQQALKVQPNLELAKQLQDILDRGMLYEVVGRWPSEEGAKPVTQVQGPWPDERPKPGPNVCPHCGQPMP